MLAEMWVRFGRCVRTLWTGALLSFVLAEPALAEDVLSLISKGPYIQAPAPGVLSVRWESPTNHPGTVRFGLGGNLDQQAEDIVPRLMKGRFSSSKTNVIMVETNFVIFRKTKVIEVPKTNFYYLYEALLKDLRPGAAYSYQVDVDGQRSEPHTVKPLGAGGDAVRFVAYGDTRTSPRIHTALARRFQADQPDFILHTGDLVDKGKDYVVWMKEFFTPMAGVLSEVPFFPVVGNHEEDATNYLSYFHLPGRGLWYSFEAGPVHVLALDYRLEKSSSDQFKFASNDLMSARAPWKVVICHYPVFNIGGHTMGWGQTNYLPLFHQAKVDLVLGGHSHLYERFRPVASRSRPGEWPLTCITTGGGGAELHPSRHHPALLAYATTNHYVVFDVTRDTLRGRTVVASGGEIDRFEIAKPGGQYTAEHLAQVFDEESLKLFYDLSPNLAGRADALPTTNSSAHVLLTVEPCKRSSKPVEIEITLLPESLKYYELVNTPLLVTLPPKGGTNRNVWAEIRATGLKKITEEGGRDLGPPLVFVAKVKTQEAELLVPGIRTRLSKTAEELAKKLWPVGENRPN
jgi:acid phosphatase type 7